MTAVAHAGHWATWLAVIVPPLLVVGWMLVLSRRGRRKRRDGG